MSNLNTLVTVTQAPVFMLDLSGELVNDPRTGKRDSSGKFLRQHVSTNQPVEKFSSSDVELASRFSCDVEELFLGKR